MVEQLLKVWPNLYKGKTDVDLCSLTLHINKFAAEIILTALKNIVGEKKPRITCREMKNEDPV